MQASSSADEQSCVGARLQSLLLQPGPLAPQAALQVLSLLRVQQQPEQQHAARLDELCQSVLLAHARTSDPHRSRLFDRAVALGILPSDVSLTPPEALDMSASMPLWQEANDVAAGARDASSKMCQELNKWLARQPEPQPGAKQAAAVPSKPTHGPGPRPQLQPGPLHSSSSGQAQAQDAAPAAPAFTGRWSVQPKRPLPGGDEEQQQQQQQQPPPPKTLGFQTALQKLGVEAAKKGQPMPQMPQPRMQGLVRPAKRPATCGPGANGGRAGGGGGAAPFVARAAQDAAQAANADKPPEAQFSEKVLALLGDQDGNLPEAIEKLDPKIVELVCNEILDSSSGATSWDDIAGLEPAKKLVQEIVVWPMLNPQLFKGPRAPPKGLLLFGPPGTGKTLIGRAIASNIHATFFSISASSLTSKWIGESEKLVRALFAVAGCFTSSVIFVDEIDSILTARKSEGEHEASRRLKTEMLIQMEGCSPAGERRLLLVGATNRPEELDEAARRRMPKQLYIPLPCGEARMQMVLRQLRDVRYELSQAEMDKVVAKTDGYSGSDMRNFVQEACQAPVRDAVAHHGAGVQQLSEHDLRPVRLRDFQLASKAQKASVTQEEVQRYIQYDARHGAKYVDVAGEHDMDEDDW